MARVTIPIETKVREFDGKLWLGLNLVARGHEVVLGPLREIKPTLYRSPPDVYITKDPVDFESKLSKLDYLQEADVRVCGLATEGGVNVPPEKWSSNRREVLNHLDSFFAWGSAHSKEICRYYDKPENVFVTGNPRFDLLRPEIRSFYNTRGLQLGKNYRDFVLVNTNFGQANPFERSVRGFASNRDSNPQDADEIIQQKRIFYAFIEAILYLQAEFSDLDVVVRPHPGEDHEFYENVFNGHNRIHVKHTGDVRSWIAASKVVLHADCTTGIESALMEKPVISYRPLADKSTKSSLPQVVSESAFNRDELGRLINRYLVSDDPYQLSNEQKDALRPYFHNVDSLAAKEICDVIDQLETSDTPSRSRLKPDIISRIKYRIRTGPMGDYITPIYDHIREISSGSSDRARRKKSFQKFPELSKSEIINTGSKLVEIAELEPFSVKRLPGTRDTYMIGPKS